MKIVDVKETAIPDVKIVTFARFCDHRGYFTEPFRQSQFLEEIPFLKDVRFVQVNESYSKTGVMRGLHFQWNPFMGKLVRTVQGRMVDLFLDIRKGSPFFGKIGAYEITADPEKNSADWIWVPPGFAHGNFFTEDTIIEYFCSGEYSPGCEAGISPLASDIDWEVCDTGLKAEFDALTKNTSTMTEKDINGFSVSSWTNDERSNNFRYENLK